MAKGSDTETPEEGVRRQVRRTIVNVVALVLSLGFLVTWAVVFGYYEVRPGEAAVILRFGRYVETVTRTGPNWHLPPPLESHEIVQVESIEREEFGLYGQSEPTPQQQLEGTVQTRDNNIAHIGFVVQYRIKDAFFSRYRIGSPRETLRDTAQAVIREVIGHTTIDGVLSDQRGDVQVETKRLLQNVLDRYESGLLIQSVELKEVQPPTEVRDAFDDVVAADQDRTRKVNEAEGYANEVLPKARAEATELRQSAEGYRDSKIAEAAGEAARFTALLTEYRKAPEVTRRRLYLETMEEILPEVEKVIIEPGTASVLPYLPLGRNAPVGEGAR